MRHREETVKRHRSAVLWTAALLVVLVAGCDNRVQVDGPRILPPTIPTAPSAPAAGDLVDIQVGGGESLTITAPERVMSLLTSEVSGGMLELDRNSPSYQGQASDIHYEIGLVRLDELMLDGVGQIDARGIDSSRFVVRLDGVGDVMVAGRADRQEVRMAGLGRYDAPLLDSRIAEVHLASGTAVIRVTERIEGWVGFGATLEYWGDAEVSVRGEGHVVHLGVKP